MVGEAAAFHADGVHFLHVFGYGHEGRDGAEGLSKIIGVEAGRDHADSAVGKGLADRCEIQVSYAIGVAQPTSVNVNTFASEIVLPSYERMDEVALLKVTA